MSKLKYVKDKSNYKRTITFLDKDCKEYRLDVEIVFDRNKHIKHYRNGEFTISGRCGFSSGQCNSFIPANDYQATLLKLWNTQHLNKKLLSVNFRAELDNLLSEIVQLEVNRFNNPLTEDESLKVCELIISERVRAFVHVKELSLNQISRIILNDSDGIISLDGFQYFVITDDEAESRCKDYLEEYLWIEAVKSGRTTSSLEEWKSEVISDDGYGAILNSYDGSEEYVEVDGVGYYIIDN